MSRPDSPNLLFGRKFYRQVEAHTEEADAKFLMAPNHLSRDFPDKTYFISVMLEEVGKLARCCNKLAITPPHYDTRQQWDREGRHRLITIASMARRMAERWDDLPDEQSGDWHIGGDR